MGSLNDETVLTANILTSISVNNRLEISDGGNTFNYRFVVTVFPHFAAA